MIFAVPIISGLILGFCWASSLSRGSAFEANRRPADELVKLDAHDDFNILPFSSAYYQGLYNVTVEDAVRLERAIAEIMNLFRGGYRHEQYYMLLREMVGRCSVESFRCVYPHIEMSDMATWLMVLLLINCAERNKVELLEYLMYGSHGFEADSFIKELIAVAAAHNNPEACVEVVGLVAARDAQVEARKYEVYTDLLESFIGNEYAQNEDEDFEELARELVDLGADVTDRIFEAIKRQFPDLTALHQFLRDSAIPDCKQPDDSRY